MTENGKSWWKGSFPMWIVMVLLGIISIGVHRTLAELDKVHDAVVDHSTRIAVLESEVRAVAASLKKP